MVDAPRRAGVRRIVFSSVIDPVLSALDNHAAKAPVEEAIIESGLEFALLQPTLFFQNLARGWPQVVKTGVYTEPWSAETRFSRVDYREVAALMGEVLGRPVRAGDGPAGATGGAPPPMQKMFAWYDRRGLLGNALTLRAALGREPRTLRAYIEELAAPPRPGAAH